MKAKLRRRIGALLFAVVGLSAGCSHAAEDAAEDVVGRMGTYRTTYDDTLHEVARRFGLGFVELLAANPGVDPWLPGNGTVITLPTAHLLPDGPREGLVINLAEMRLYYFPAPGKPPETYPVGIGREGRTTPIGKTRILRKATAPTWYPTKSIRAERPELPAVVPPGPDNPLGEFALYLDWPAYLIHGTNKPWGIGRRASSGCIRMYPEDIDGLFERLPIGTPVVVLRQPVKLGWIEGELFIEVHPSESQADQLETTGRFKGGSDDFGDAVAKVRTAAGSQANRLDFSAIRRAVREKRGYPVRITRSGLPGSRASTVPSIHGSGLFIDYFCCESWNAR
ncbi:L,D-transpeptidase family protein [Rhodospirillaceae bacterium SYSU D60014]|uniref:L,D-transpeptidase family protein n=1 Tax=Virgifigura deserti TaxID=2268457 RepID=UPI0013C3FCEE